MIQCYIYVIALEINKLMISRILINLWSLRYCILDHLNANNVSSQKKPQFFGSWNRSVVKGCKTWNLNMVSFHIRYTY